jgi:uncharacterized protein YecE (DUF72 family)
MKIYVGTSGFGYAEWKGKFYPAGLPIERALEYYAGRFTAVEINSSFYRIPTADTVLDWASRVPRRFVFAFKAPGRITHVKRLLGAEPEMERFLRAVSILKKQLGPINFQLPPNFKADTARLRDFLTRLPSGHRYAFEFRHVSWFTGEIYALLRSARAALVLNDEIDGAPKTPVKTADFGFIKLRTLDYDGRDLRGWTREIGRHGWKSVFVFFKHEEKALGPRFGEKFKKLLPP